MTPSRCQDPLREKGAPPEPRRASCLRVPAATLLLLAFSAVTWAPAGPAVVPRTPAAEAPVATVARNASDGTTTYRAAAGDCVVAWVARDVEPGVVLHRSRCGASLAREVPLIQAVGAAFLAQDPHADAWRTLFWGRLAPDDARDGPQDLACRLALAAHGSPGWDGRKGKPRGGDINGFVRDLADRAMIYPELRVLFGSLGREVRFASAEKVLVARAGDLPFYDRLQPHGVVPGEKLPFDCLAWFAVGAPERVPDKTPAD
jgi:hypothetical protein